MQITCNCLNVIIYSRGSIIENYDFKTKYSSLEHLFFKENIGCVELESLHKEQSALVAVESYGEWLIHRCLNCRLYTHALNTASTAIVLVNQALLTKPQDIASLKNSEKYSPAFHIIIDNKDEDENNPISGTRNTSGVMAGLNMQLSEWLRREAAQTEERVKQFSEQQYAALDTLRARAHRDHLTLSRILVEAGAGQNTGGSLDARKPEPQFSTFQKTHHSSTTPQRTIPVLPDPAKVIAKKPTQQQTANRPRNLARKPSVDAEGLFDLDGMDDTTETFASDEELSDTDDSGSHDEGIHIPRHVNSNTIYAKSLPVNISLPAFTQHPSDHDSPTTDFRVPQEPVMDIAASIKALAKSVHGDAVFGDLPRPRFSTQI